jgi:hypothetical protein
MREAFIAGYKPDKKPIPKEKAKPNNIPCIGIK